MLVNLNNSKFYFLFAVEGLCRGVSAGNVDVTFNIGACTPTAHNTGNALTGWQSTSRIVVEELDVKDVNLID